MSRFQPLRPKSYLFRNCITGLAVATLVSTQPAVAQTVAPPKDTSVRTPELINQATANYQDPVDPTKQLNSSSKVVNTYPKSGLVDPLGIITGCDGKVLDNYKDYSVTLYDVAPDGLNLAAVVVTTTTTASNGLPPNIFNRNPFLLENPLDPPVSRENKGRYNFLFDRDRGQLDVGRKYILVVKPPSNSNFGERRVLLEIISFEPGVRGNPTANPPIPNIPDKLRYRATSLDGKKISTTSNQAAVEGESELEITDGANVGLGFSLVSLGLDTGICEDEPVQLTKSADRATAEPGDTVVYRLTLRNQTTDTLKSNAIFDTLPRGMSLRPDTVRAQNGAITIPVAITRNGSADVFRLCQTNTPTPIVNPNSNTCAGATGFDILPGQTVNLAYAVTIDPDAIRGTGRNNAIWQYERNGVEDRDSANNTVQIRPGLIRDTGTLIGRVFVDKNFDGQQQVNEPGIPNAVIYLDDGNRVTTDLNGLFSVQSAVAGYRTGALDLSTLPGYSLAPNLYFSERNSRSRLVKLAPGGIVRMNFGVTPTAREVK